MLYVWLFACWQLVCASMPNNNNTDRGLLPWLVRGHGILSLKIFVFLASLGVGSGTNRKLFCLNKCWQAGFKAFHSSDRASFQIFLGGGQIFFYFSMPPDYWKIGKKQHFICSNLTLFIVPFFLFSSFFSFFLFFLFFLTFFFFFSLGGGGGGDGPPAPLKWRLCLPSTFFVLSVLILSV